MYLPESNIFQEVPDIIIDKTKAILISCNKDEQISDDTSSDEHVVIEQSFQRNPLKSSSGITISVKVGKLLATLYFILLCKIPRKIIKKMHVYVVSVHGFLVDKVIGSIHCKLTSHISKVDVLHEVAVKALHVEIHDATGGSLTAESLL